MVRKRLHAVWRACLIYCTQGPEIRAAHDSVVVQVTRLCVGGVPLRALPVCRGRQAVRAKAPASSCEKRLSGVAWGVHPHSSHGALGELTLVPAACSQGGPAACGGATGALALRTFPCQQQVLCQFTTRRASVLLGRVREPTQPVSYACTQQRTAAFQTC